MASGRRTGLGKLWSWVAARGPVPHRPTFTASIFAALLAVGVVLGFVAFRTTDQPARSALPPSTSVPAPVHVPTTTLPPTTTATTPPTTPPTTDAVATQVGPCRRADLQVTVSVSGGPGATEVTTELRDIAPCTWQPVTVSGYPCPDTIVVVDAGGSQVWPAPGQAEQCSTPAGRVLTPGQDESLSATWDNRVLAGGATTPAPRGQYAAVGTWSWATDGGRPDQASQSQPFTLG